MAGVYISFPFCAQKCTYCNFASGVFPAGLESEYLEALAGEAGSHEWRWTPETVYVGGGTPSRLEPERLAALLQTAPGAPWVEATIEAAPGDISAGRAAGWRAAGINRVSMGVQSFIRKELAQTGRKHSAELVADEVRRLREAGIANLSIDLIAGLPFQTRASFEESLDWAERLDVPHVSVYMLEVDEGSRLGKEMLAGGGRFGAATTPGEDEIVEMYQTAVERLRAMGLARYEISNFARPGFESLHNLKYWRLEPYVGFGADAHSLDGGVRWQNVESAAEYVARWKAGDAVCAARSAAHPDEERFFVGLRLAEGITVEDAEWPRLIRFVAEGLMERAGNRVRLTGRGVLYSNEVLEEFVNV
jgi:oxygen-independent coproporphyrinogen-3 oxidase